ncbi:hypothetical protein DA717_08555 [Piscirickettsiaceae bacterium NZ-RLO2]|nr:hypothetical protein DA717_08555 [Piscirickettsiaceae bacterium NZ-RLO2]
MKENENSKKDINLDQQQYYTYSYCSYCAYHLLRIKYSSQPHC